MSRTAANRQEEPKKTKSGRVQIQCLMCFNFTITIFLCAFMFCYIAVINLIEVCFKFVSGSTQSPDFPTAKPLFGQQMNCNDNCNT